jgi:hypothetical protein
MCFSQRIGLPLPQDVPLSIAQAELSLLQQSDSGDFLSKKAAFANSVEL